MTLAERLAAQTMELLAIPSVSRDESPVLEHVRQRMAGARGMRAVVDDDAALLYLPDGDGPIVILAGHVDTVPGGPESARDGDVLIGRGASDMKGAVAVMLALAEDGAGDGDLRVGYLFFGREEIPIAESALRPLLAASEELRSAALAIVMEPTSNELELGCNGNLNARVVATGRAAHSARPWLGDNAVHALIEALAPLADLPIRDVEVGGLTYREVASVTMIEGGVAGNVVPGEASAHVNFRYAPTHTAEQAEARLRELVGHHSARVEILGNAPPGPVPAENPLVERLRRAAGLDEPRPKQAWTPVAEFGEAGVDAVNFGPGDPRYAHTDDERVEVAALVESYEMLTAFFRAG